MDRKPFNMDPAPGAESAPGVGAEPPDGNGHPHGVGDAFGIAGEKFREVGDYVSLYISSRIDLVLATMRRIGIYAGLGVVALIAAAGVLVTAVVLICMGIAEGLTQLFGGRVWLGDLVTGVVIFLAICATIYIGVSRILTAARNRTVKKYEERQRHI